MKTIFLIIPLFILSCSTNKLTQHKDNFDDKSNLILELRENSLENFDSIFTIKNDTELGKTLGPINATRMPGVPIRNIDFTKEYLFVTNMKTDINIIDIKNSTILYEKIYDNNVESTFNQENLIKFYQIPFSNSPYKFQEIKK
ncbi:hypothetical protein [Empedobacter sp. UBA7494]|uniref:hypothetical protein n=1 Tax=Empedobacter sp. UBA7494 TaxID=1946450 RepID=UPI0025C349F5|nr:hypothetical protein [Empedobacter sp. UBA7494]